MLKSATFESLLCRPQPRSHVSEFKDRCGECKRSSSPLYVVWVTFLQALTKICSIEVCRRWVRQFRPSVRKHILTVQRGRGWFVMGVSLEVEVKYSQRTPSASLPDLTKRRPQYELVFRANKQDQVINYHFIADFKVALINLFFSSGDRDICLRSWWRPKSELKGEELFLRKTKED